MISGGHDSFPIIKEDYPQPTVSYNTAAKGNIVHLPSSITRSKRNYAPLEKLALALPHVSRRLRRYFEAHPIKVITDQPIEQILSKAEASGKLAKYSIKLGAYNIAYKPHSEVKGQVLADFINETGGLVSKASGAGLILISPTKTEYTYALRLNFTSTNNQAEYEALLAGLRIEKKMNVQSLSVNVDSKLVAS
ncbi:reverse transcriptase domain-containing protein [Tanacetum coccineum]